MGGPYIEGLRNNNYLKAALSGITAAVVGVILNLAVWFGLRVAFSEIGSINLGGISLPILKIDSADLTAITLTFVAAVATFRFNLGVLRTLGICGMGGFLAHVLI